MPEDERCLSDWMKLDARVCWVEHPRPWELEHELLGTIGLPLNPDGNHHHPFRAELSRVRFEARARARAFAAGA